MPHFLSPESLIATFGLLGILAIVFAESGLLLGFFLPGDSLLFTAGLLVADGRYLHQPFWVVCLLITGAAIAGDQVGFVFGRRVGPALYRRPDSRLFKKAYLERVRGVFERYGPRSIVLARFVSVVRTFTPIVAGVARMPYRTFVVYNVVGGALWSFGLPSAGYVLGRIAFVRHHIELILVALVALSAAPLVVEFVRHRAAARKKVPEPAGRR
ncbi:DedA family protein [Cryptosporangium phraense]|uniref:DedA family protein n=1 Tax=Cryptosporangium phraense TaxID=2593070 RepID=A0A545AP84_9ACTN|nr:VTT domain-containing protein [Cryptosporangium phraense]TQS43100.1 DedA family protein [Cryptosporangium phraense]